MAFYAAYDATLRDAEYLAPRLQEADRAEIWALNRHTPIQALTAAVEHHSASVWCVNSDPVMMFGCPPKAFLDPYVGVPWLLGTNLIARHPKAFITQNKQALAEWLPKYRLLENYVDSRHLVAVKWLARLGFMIHKPLPIGPDSMMFHRFTMRGFYV